MGSALGAAACTIYSQAPLDIVRARIFSPKAIEALGLYGGPAAAGTSAVSVARQMMREEGLHSFWKGASINLVRYAPHAVLSFYLIDVFKSIAKQACTDTTKP